MFGPAARRPRHPGLGPAAYLKEPGRLRVPSSVRRQRLARSSSPRRVREREAVTFGASPAQGTGPRAAPASSHSCCAPQGTRPKARPAGPFGGPRRAAGIPSRLTLLLVLLPPSKMAAPAPAKKKLSGGPGKRALHSVLFLPTCGTTVSAAAARARLAGHFERGSGFYRSGLNVGPASPKGAWPRHPAGRHFGAGQVVG